MAVQFTQFEIPRPRTFWLERDGEKVLEGVEFSDGRVVVNWCTDRLPHSTVVWNSIMDFIGVSFQFVPGHTATLHFATHYIEPLEGGIYRATDYRQHDISSDCWCEPEVEYVASAGVEAHECGCCEQCCRDYGVHLEEVDATG